MHRRFLACVGLFGWALGAVERGVSQATLVADAHVNAALPAVNSGGISNVSVGGGYTGLRQFDLSLLPVGTTAAQVSRAVLVLYVNRVDTPGTVNLQPVTSAWSESTVTYATMPTLGAAVQAPQVSVAGTYLPIDVTGLVQGWIAAPATNSGVALTASAAVFAIDSKENDLTGHPAVLEVELSSASAVGPAGPAGPQGLPGPAGVNGAAGPQGPQGLSGPTGATGPAGLAGVPGATGPAGPDGSPGLTGPVGPAGANGIAGPTGPAGPAGPAGTDGGAGFSYQGPYQSAANYGMGDVVLWLGGSWTSLQAQNQGNTPDQSPAAWGLLTAPGPQGPAGAVGPTGAAGPPGAPGLMGYQGPAGPQGPAGTDGASGPPGLTGAIGPMGPGGAQGLQGIPGPVGLSFVGVYDSTVNYSLANGVSYRGAGYVSLIEGNHGNVPDQSPTAWGLFAAAGTDGAPGAVGSIGPTGPSGPEGATGSTGAAGPAGPQGLQGPPGVNFRGMYSSAASYEEADAVSYAGSTYISLTTLNVGNTPDQSPADWAVLAAQGPTGPVGANGANGAQGPAGASGAAGATGPAGPPVTFLGEWLGGTAYAEGDAVSYAGASYIALSGNSGREPDLSPVYWGLLAAAGAAGAAGPQGLPGAQGPSGFQGPVGATGASGPAGPSGPAGVNWRGAYSLNAVYGTGDAVIYGGASYLSLTGGNMGNAPDASPSQWGLLAAAGMAGAMGPAGQQGVTGPQGPAGNAGAAGPAGQTGVDFRGAWNSGTNYAVGDAVAFAGSTYLAVSANVAVEPDGNASVWTVLAAAGSAGPSGASGIAASVAVGTVTTGAPGTNAAVVNAGTSSAAVLNFTIPQGAAGGAGSGGAGSGVSTGFGSMEHQVSYAAVYYAVNNPNQSAAEDASVLTWVPNGCTATQLQVYSLQGANITVTLRAGTIGAMADTSLTCQVSAGGSCSASGPVNIPAGGFVDLSVAHADSVAQGVWTAVSCQ